MEAALAMGAFGVVLAGALGGVSAAATQLHCVDAAREAARLAALGDRDGAVRVAARIAPGGALSIRADAGEIRAEVTAAPAGGLIPGLLLSGEAFAVPESGAAPPDKQGPP